MKISKLKIRNFRSFGETEKIIEMDNLSVLIGKNSVGKTAAMIALNKMFSSNPSDRILVRSDFHLPAGKKPDQVNHLDLSVEADFTFDELDEEKDEDNDQAVPAFFHYLVVDENDPKPYLRIRLEASWQRNNSIDGDVDSHIYYVTCSENDDIKDENKKPINRFDLSANIRVLYVPATRNPTHQLHNVSGSMIYQMLSNIEWSESEKSEINHQIDELNKTFIQKHDIADISNSISSEWQQYDEDKRYSNAKLNFSTPDFDAIFKRSDIVFSPTETERDYTVDEMGDGFKSLFYISLVNSLLRIEEEYNESSFEKRRVSQCPILTIVALEEPENHISPHLLGRVLYNLQSIAQNKNSQVIITTHSPSMVKRVDPIHLRYLRLNKNDQSTYVSRISFSCDEKISEKYKFLKEAIQAYPEIYFAQLVILGEGDSEEIILSKFWERLNQKPDLNGISVVPLGGRYVNHFWRLLSDLHIPHITLLDLDLGREGAGWGRIKYIIQQLILNDEEKKKELFDNGFDKLDDNLLEQMHQRSYTANNKKKLKQWINLLEKQHVYFSAPLDIDFLMLESYGAIYKSMLSFAEGPSITVGSSKNKETKYIRDIEGETDKGIFTKAYESRIKKDVQHALKKNGKERDIYTKDEKRLLIWYTYFFLNRGKPTTHIEAMTHVSDDELINNMPGVFRRLFDDAEVLLSEN